MLTRRLLLALTATVSLTAGAEDAVAADAYPSRAVTLIVPYAAGGASDTVARIIAESMSQTLGQQMVVENVGGASGTIGAARVARADPDGYTIMLHTPTPPASSWSTSGPTGTRSRSAMPGWAGPRTSAAC
jgi:tripartite-type tricarboxylate transporter receptor subunit TctC